MAHTEEFTTVISLNDKDAKDKLQSLRELVKKAKADLDDAIKNGASTKEIKNFRSELKRAETQLKAYSSGVSDVIHTVKNLGTASAEEIKRAIRALRKQQQEATNPEDYNKMQSHIDNCSKRLVELQHNQELVNQTMKNLSGAKVKDLEQTVKLLNARLKETEKGSEEYKKLTGQLKAVKAELQDINDETKESQSLWGRLSGFLNKNWGAFTQMIGSLTGLTVAVKQAVEQYSQMEEAMANVRKYTGQTTEQVREMNEDFKKIDTRTSREELNELAGSAGRLGITSTKDIEDFVDAADKISVALGDDLGDGAIDKVGKLAMAFGEDERLGLRGAMLATGSAINELAQNSSAQAGYLVEFTARVAGVAKTLGMSQADIMGYGAVLDETMQKDEMAATAFSQLLSKMASNTKTFAKLAGKDAKEFADLVKNDVNGAVIALMQNIGKQGGFEQMAKMFDDMGLDGTRALSVLTTMADKIQLVQERQKTANDAYAEGTSVIEEFDVQNTTVQAGLDKAKKAFNEIMIVLGEKLMPVARVGITTASAVANVLSVLATFIIDNWKALAVLTSGIVAYNVALNITAIKEALVSAKKTINIALSKAHAAAIAVENVAIKAKNILLDLLTGKITLAQAAQKLLNKAVLSNPYVAAAAAMAAVTAALVKFASKADNATEAQKRLNEANDEAAASCRSEIVELDTLIKRAQDKSLADDVRRAAIEELQKKYPDYLQNLSLENINSTTTRKAVDNLTNSILAQAQARVYLSKIEEMQRKQMEIEEEYLNSFWGKMWQTLKANFQSGVNDIADSLERGKNAIRTLFERGDFSGWDWTTSISGEGYGTSTLQVYINNMKADLKEYQDYEKMYVAEYQKIQNEEAQRIAKIREAAKKKNEEDEKKDPEYKSEKELKREALEKRIEEAAKRKQEAERKKNLKDAIAAQKALAATEQTENARAYAAGEITYREYLERKQQLALDDLDEQIRIYGKDADEAKNLLYKKEQMQAQYSDYTRKLDEEDIKRAEKVNQIRLEMDYEDSNSDIYHNDIALQEALFQNERDSLVKRRDLYEKTSQEWLNLNAEITERDEEHQLELRQRNADLLARYREQWAGRDMAETQRITLQGLEYLHQKELISHEEYEQMKKQITLRYDEETRYEQLRRAEQDRDNSRNETVSHNASTAYQTAKANAQAQLGNSETPSLGSFLMGDINMYKSTMAQLHEMYADVLNKNGVLDKEDQERYEEYQQAKSQAFGNFASGIGSKMQAAYDAITPILNGMSSYWSAQSQYEQNVTTKKYDKLIKAAGNNSAKTKKLEEKKQKELAEIKSKYNKRAMKMEIAQATATMILGAMNAYTSAFKGAPYPANLVLAPVAAGIALAAGALNIATIKKQHDAEAAGFYLGGFTGGSSYRREAGVVHEGEFVANHDAVNNRRLLPALHLIDQAQRNNTVGSLTADDITRSVGGGATVVSAPTVNVQTDNSEVVATMQEAREVIDRLSSQLEQGIHASVTMDGEDGFVRAQRRWERLQGNK